MTHLFAAILLTMALLTSCDQANIQPSSYTVNSATSRASWKGSAPDHFHLGSFQVMGSLSLTSSGQLDAGNFRIPISSMTDFDLPSPVKEQLLDHLKSADFFNLLLYPEASFTLTQVRPYSGPSPVTLPGANTLITGDFTLLGQTHSITFPGTVHSNADSLWAEAALTIDRTQWGMSRYSDSTSTGLYILPDVSLQLSLQATN